MTADPTLDHIVINVRTDMDRCEDLFARMGFTMTPRGYHSLGSINALSIFTNDYLELLGLPPERPDARPELLGAPLGLNGVVFKTSNADETHAHLASLGIDAAPPKSFSRPVTLADGQQGDACFRTVTLPTERFPAGRFYFCEHQTPKMVWRPEWQSHRNGAIGFAELMIATADPVGDAELVAAILGLKPTDTGADDGPVLELNGGVTLSFVAPGALRTRFGEHAVTLDGRSAALGAVTIHADWPDDLAAELQSQPDDFVVSARAAEMWIKLPMFNTLVILARGA